MEQHKLPEHKAWSEKDTAAFHALVAAKVMPPFYDAVTWALHETQRNFTEDERGEASLAMIVSVVGHLSQDLARVVAPCCRSHQKVAFRAISKEIITDLQINLLDDTDVHGAEGQVEREDLTDLDAIAEKAGDQLAHLMEQMDHSIARLTPPGMGTRAQGVAGMNLIAGLLAHLVIRFNVNQDATRLETWLRALTDALGIGTSVEFELIREPRPRG